jgi:hypothetical protein
LRESRFDVRYTVGVAGGGKWNIGGVARGRNADKRSMEVQWWKVVKMRRRLAGMFQGVVLFRRRRCVAS